MRSRTALTLVIAATAAQAEPVVTPFDIYSDTSPSSWGINRFIDLHDYDTRYPDARLIVAELGGGGVAEDTFAVEPAPGAAPFGSETYLTGHNDPDWFLFERDTEPGTPNPLGGPAGVWTDAIANDGLPHQLPILRMFPWESYNALPCDYSAGNTTVIERSPVFFYPLRVEETPGSYRYGWLAVQAVDLFNNCDADCVFNGNELNTECMTPLFRWVGIGFETSTDTPIVVGGGLCPADLTFDAVLDLADLQSFVTGFTGQTAPGDYDDNGIFDLSDVQGFIGDFTTGCGL